MQSVFSAIVIACLLALVHGFSAQPPTRPDTSRYVEEALKITAAYGIQSSQAKVAWDIVEGTNKTTTTMEFVYACCYPCLSFSRMDPLPLLSISRNGFQ
jgi:hypothetical protein